MSELDGKTAIITGASKGIGEATVREFISRGVNVIAGSRSLNNLEGFMSKLSSHADRVHPIQCDVSDEGSVKRAFDQIKNEWGKLDFFVHAVAFADKNELRGKYVNTSKENFLNSLNISCYSFTESCKYCYDLMDDGGSILTLTYYGAEQVMPHYNVMGVAKSALEASVKYLAVDMGDKNIRVNAISAGPIKTLAASGIGDFRFILKWNELNSPLKRNVTLEDVGNTGTYLLSDLSSGVTGEIHHVDCGYHTVGMVAVDEAEGVAGLLNEFSNK